MWWTAPIAVALAANPHLDEARRLYEQLKYPDAVARLRVAQKAPNNSPEERFSIDDLLARALIAEGKPADAERVYAELLTDQPDAPDPKDASPKIRDVFLKAKRGVYPDDFVKLERGPAPPDVVEATLTDPWRRVASITLTCDAERVALSATKRISTRLPEHATHCTLTADATNGTPLTSVTWGITRIDLGEQVVVSQTPSGPARWPAYLLGAVTIGAIAAGTVLAVLASMDYRQVTPTTDAATTRMLDDRSRTKAGAAYGAFAGALLAAAATIVVILRF